MADINEFLICKLCKGYLRDPYTVKECLHTCTLSNCASSFLIKTFDS